MSDERHFNWRDAFSQTPLADAIRQIPNSNDPPTCRHGRTLLIPCSACDQFNKPLKEKE